jgi:hypothetical protein
MSSKSYFLCKDERHGEIEVNEKFSYARSRGALRRL